MMEFSSLKSLKARKQHVCTVCGKKIEKGETYKRLSGKYEGEFFDDCFHESCYDLCQEFCRDTDDEEYTTDLVGSWIYEKVCADCENEEQCAENSFRCKKVIEKILEEA